MARGVLRAAAATLLALTVLCGVAYPVVVTATARLCFAWQADGSLIRARDGRVIGSAWVGQPFRARGYFWGRPSAVAGDPRTSGGRNLGPRNPALIAAVTTRVAAMREADPAHRAPVPVDLVTASASGLDPDISPAAARYQAPRVAGARGLSVLQVEQLIDDHVEARVLGVLGEPRVNVLRLNLALDALGAGPR